MDSPITSDITLDASKFLPSQIPENTTKINKAVEDMTVKADHWWVVGAQRYRDMRIKGKSTLPPPVFLPGAKDAEIPSREPGRTIPIRYYVPDNGQPARGILLHVHGGGFVIGSHQYADSNLRKFAYECQLVAISTGYRHAPEYPYPAAPNDCVDVAEYLVDRGEKEFGAPLSFLAGESAGANLAVLSAFHVLKARPDHLLKGLVLPFGWFDLSMSLPQASTFDRPLVVTLEDLAQFHEAYVPGWSVEERKNPAVSPLREDLQALAAKCPGGKLPPALMLCGTADPLLDDTVLMGTKWLATGSEAVIKIYPGCAHGFTVVPGLEAAQEASELTLKWLKERLSS